ncbi:MAG: GNAT family N-acetyltransferase [Inquilinus sp.]|nr:GNAT family N-acetyltransferase [Inquilinus sp.]
MAEIGTLFREYADFLDFSLCFQDFERELAELPGFYAPPAGRLWLARVDGAVAGCVGLRPYGASKCEMKRLYLRPGYRGLGLGRRLAELTVAAAEEIGYPIMRLDTVPKLATAIALYRDMGFVTVSEPEPEGAPGGLLVFEKRLGAAGP